MSLVQALIIAIMVGLAYLARRIGGDPQLERPIILAPIIGLMLGDFQTGLVVGGTLELIFIGAASIGGTAPPNVAIGTAVGTALAINSGQGLQTALALAVPVAVVGTFFELFAKGASSFLVHRADKDAETANSARILQTVWMGNTLHFLAYAIPTFIALYFGAGVVNAMTSALSGRVSDGLKVAAVLLPAVGFGILLSVLFSRQLFPLFLAGFALAAYTDFTVIGVALISVSIVLVVLVRSAVGARQQAEAAVSQADPSGIISGESPKQRKRYIRRLMWRGLLLQAAFNYERFQNLGFWWMMRPTLDRLHPEPEARAAAYQRHLVYFNTHPWFIGPIAGVVAGMERQNAAGEDVDDEAITSVKVGLMAPLAGIGDSLVFGTIRPIFSGVCAALAVAGNAVGPFLFFFGLLIIQFALRFYGTSLGYNFGTNFFDRLSPAQIERVKTGATIVGLAVAGALTATLVNVTTALAYHSGKATIKVQEALDQVLPAMLPLAATLIVFILIRRRLSPVLVLLGTAVVGVVAGYFGILSAG